MMNYQTPTKYLLRCAFPRGRILSQIEDELSILTQFVSRFTPKDKEQFDTLIDSEYAKLRSVSAKSIKNYRTEMTKLFGLITVGSDGVVQASERTNLLVESQNFPLFFKTFCHRFQFPNGINKPQETAKQIEAGAQFKPAKFILDLFVLGVEKCGQDFSINGNEISNLVFNDVRVTSGKMSPHQVLDFLLKLRSGHVRFAGGSKIAQHGREFLGYMLLARLLKEGENGFRLNEKERQAIDYIRQSELFFNVPRDFATNTSTRKQLQYEWGLWFGDVSQIEKEKLAAKIERTEIPTIPVPGIEKTPEAAALAEPAQGDLKEIGDKGELVVLKYEKERIYQIRPDRIGLVRRVSNDTALGYDIQSLEFDDVSKKKFIEVKTTERTFPPSEEILTYFPMSGNEWETAKTHGDSYYIYRVFLTAKEPAVFVIKNPVMRCEEGHIILEPLKYRVIVKKQAGSYTK